MMYIKFSPQVKKDERIRYSFLGELIKVNFYQLMAVNEEGKEYSVNEEFVRSEYIDTSHIESGRLYQAEHPIVSIRRDENSDIHVELLNYVSEDAPENERFTDWWELDVITDELSIFNSGLADEFQAVRSEELIINEPVYTISNEELQEQNRSLQEEVDNLKESLSVMRDIHSDSIEELKTMVQAVLSSSE